MKQQERATRKTEVEREIPDWPEIPSEVIARFPSMRDYYHRQAEAWHTLKLVLREIREEQI
jgi:hypothetical protein